LNFYGCKCILKVRHLESFWCINKITRVSYTFKKIVRGQLWPSWWERGVANLFLFIVENTADIGVCPKSHLLTFIEMYLWRRLLATCLVSGMLPGFFSYLLHMVRCVGIPEWALQFLPNWWQMEEQIITNYWACLSSKMLRSWTIVWKSGFGCVTQGIILSRNSIIKLIFCPLCDNDPNVNLAWKKMVFWCRFLSLDTVYMYDGTVLFFQQHRLRILLVCASYHLIIVWATLASYYPMETWEISSHFAINDSVWHARKIHNLTLWFSTRFCGHDVIRLYPECAKKKTACVHVFSTIVCL
jgi:hypothetical protein